MAFDVDLEPTNRVSSRDLSHSDAALPRTTTWQHGGYASDDDAFGMATVSIRLSPSNECMEGAMQTRANATDVIERYVATLNQTDGATAPRSKLGLYTAYRSALPHVDAIRFDFGICVLMGLQRTGHPMDLQRLSPPHGCPSL